MIKIGILFALTIGYLQGTAQELIPRFRISEVRTYQISSINKSPFKEPYLINNTVIKTISINVTSIESNSTSLQWTYLHVSFNDSVQEHNPILNLMNTLTEGVIVNYTVNSKGVIQSIKNYNQIVSIIQSRMDEMISDMSNDKNIESSFIESTKLQLKLMLSTEKQINKIVISDVFKFHELYGYSLIPKTLVAQTDPVSSKFEIQKHTEDRSGIQLEGKLIYSPTCEIQGNKTYLFDSSHWPTKLISKIETDIPMQLSQYYEISSL